MPTRQETFNTVKEHLLRQNARALRRNPLNDVPGENYKFIDICAYRGEGGKKCAAGVLIPDALYKEELEGKACDHSMLEAPLAGHDLRLVGRLQSCHDSIPIEDWPAKLRDIAEVEGLDYGS